MLAKLRRRYWRYFQWQEEQLLLAAETAEVRLLLSGRKRWVGHEPMAPETINFPIQGTAADIINRVLPQIEDELPSDSFITAQVHDAAYIETPKWRAESIGKLCKKVAEAPIRIHGKRRVFPVEVQIKERWLEAA